MDHKTHDVFPNYDQTAEYIKFAAVITGVFFIASVHSGFLGFSIEQFLVSFMAAFFLVFAAFKLTNIKMFAHGFFSYDIIASRWTAYGYLYPFIQLFFGVAYFFGLSSLYLDLAVLLVSLISAAGVLRTLKKKSKIHCVCLGNIIKLPLSTISLTEDLTMVVLSGIMIMLY
jgi:hypothetical protein